DGGGPWAILARGGLPTQACAAALRPPQSTRPDPRPHPLSETRARAPTGSADGGAALEGAAERDLVGVLEVAADGKTAGQLGDLEVERHEHAHQIGRGRLALEVRVGGDDDLGDRAVLEPAEQLLDPQLVRADPRDRADGSA